MTTTLLLRIASILSFAFAAGHTLGGRKSWSPMGETEVLHAMRTVQFDTYGVRRTYLDFFLGFGFSLSVLLVLQAVVLWQLAALAKTNSGAIRPIVASFMLASIGIGLVSWRFLFPVPAISCVIVAVPLAFAVFMRR